MISVGAPDVALLGNSPVLCHGSVCGTVRSYGLLGNARRAVTSDIALDPALDAIHPAILPGLGAVSAGFKTGLSAIVPILGALCPTLAITAIGAALAASIPLQFCLAGQIHPDRVGGHIDLGSDLCGGCGGGRQHRGRHETG
ncbi:hypothetical protein [Maricaulis salignorans]|uniref:hypothetical protein n=1 Tax=Maricaulis salignorans TaxID=144026 RepID=UPI003A93C5B9